MRHPVDYAPSQDFGENPTSVIYPGHPDYWIIQQFGNYQPDGHTGTDYPCPTGTPVRAAADGVVLHVGWLGGSYADNPWWIAPSFAGYVAVIDHGHFIGIYGHCLDGSAGVRKGDRVSEGDAFIRSGNTGASTGDHLHFECLPDGYVLNSYMYGRINPASLFTAGSLSYAGTTTPIEEDDEMKPEQMNELKVFIQNENVRYHEATRAAVISGVYEKAVKGVAGDGINLQQFLSEYRSHIMMITAMIDAIAVGAGISVEDVQKAITEGLSAGIKIDATVKVGG